MSDTASPPPRSNLALIISLCLNLVLAGIIAMALVRFAVHGPLFDRGRPMDPLGQSPERAQLHQALSPRMLMHVAPEKADQIHSLLRAHRARIEELRTASMAARRHTLEVFGASNFDKATFEKALAQMQAADSAFESEILKVVSETALTLTPEERQKAAAWRGHRGDDRGMRWRHSHGPDGGEAPPPGQQPPPAPPPPQ
jgi:Spy/CpxP family protein refolding chaperone